MPEGDVYKKLSNLITQLSKEYSTPNFEPHITILHSLVMMEEDIINKTRHLASTINPFKVKLNVIDYLEEYFRCLFVRAEETDDLVNLSNRAREIFNRQSDPKYMPHLSLLYGNFSAEIKKNIIKKIGSKFEEKFKVKSLNLFSSEEDISKWHRIKEFNFR